MNSYTFSVVSAVVVVVLALVFAGIHLYYARKEYNKEMEKWDGEERRKGDG